MCVTKAYVGLDVEFSTFLTSYMELNDQFYASIALPHRRAVRFL